MKSVRRIIKEMVDRYPNDMELGVGLGGTSNGCMKV